MSLPLLFYSLSLLFAFSEPKQQVEEAIRKLEKVTQKTCPQCQDLYQFDFTSQEKTKSQIENICSERSASPAAALNSTSILQLYDKIHETYLQFIKNSSVFSEEQKEALAQRFLKIPKPQIILCDSMKIHYDNLENKIAGCISKKYSLTQVGLIISHELGHAIGPCAYHASWSPFKIAKLGKALSYSKPMNYKSSLEEYPLRKIVKCQPTEVTESQLINQVNDKTWNVMCAKSKQEELFADLIGSFIYADILKQQGGIQGEQFSELAKVLCPSKGKIIEVFTSKISFKSCFE